MPPQMNVRLMDHEGFEYGVKQVDGKPRVSSMPYLYDIVEGNVEGHKAWSKMGFNSDIQAAEEVVASQGGAYVFPTGAMQLQAVSSDNTQDKGGGTGALAVTVYGLDSNYAEISETITLNGSTAVDSALSTWFRINNARVSSVGTGGKPVGNITIKGKLDGLTYGYIAAGQTRQRQFVYTVPLGKTLYITQAVVYCVHTAANKRCLVTLRATYDEKSGARLTAGKHFMAFAEAQLSDNPVSVEYPTPKKFTEKVDIIMVGISTGTAALASTMSGWLE